MIRKSPHVLSKGDPIVVVGAAEVGADASSMMPSSSVLYAGAGAAVGIGVGLLSRSTMATVLLSLLGGALGYVASTMTSPSTSMKCPDQSSDAFQQILKDIQSGKTDAATAETIAKSYDNASCGDAAAKVRAAVPPSKGTIVVGPDGKQRVVPVTPLGGVTGGAGGGKPSIGSAYMQYKLTADDAAKTVSQFRIDAGFTDDDEFLRANSAIAVYAPKTASGLPGWPPAYEFTAVVPIGDPLDTDFHWSAPRSYTPTGRIAEGADSPSYLEKETGKEVYFPVWTNGTAPGGAFSVKSYPPSSTSNGGQRMDSERGVWAWDEGMLVTIKIDSNIGKKLTAPKGKAGSP